MRWFGFGLGGGLTQAEVDARIAAAMGELAIPQPATGMPPGVADSGSRGTMTTQYALANHTHASKARKGSVVGINTATYDWTYPTPFASGVTPIILAIAQTPGTAPSDSFNVQIEGTPTNTGCRLRINRLTSGLFGLLTGALGFNPTPASITLHLLALEP